MRVLAVGISTRAIAESAFAAGLPVRTVDYFGDRDLRTWAAGVGVRRDLGRPWTPAAVVRAVGGMEYDALVYSSDLENHPRLISRLARGRQLLGNGQAVVRRVRDWRVLREIFRQEGIRHPATLLPGEERLAVGGRRWLVKPERSGGGGGIGAWDGRRLRPGQVLQEHVEGVAASAAFIADGERAEVLGLAEQLLGRAWLGAAGFAWCGNVLPLQGGLEHSGLWHDLQDVASCLTGRFGLRGINGVDFVVARDRTGGRRAYVVEVNPRYSGSVELYEQAGAGSMYQYHLEACRGVLADGRPRESRGGPHAFRAKGIVFARAAGSAPETADWQARGRRDVPFPGDALVASRPVCTVFGNGETRAECLHDLKRRAAEVYAELHEHTEGNSGRAIPAHNWAHS